MVFVCGCGKRFRAPEGTRTEGRPCPACGGTLRLAQREIARLKGENNRLRTDLDRARGTRAPLIAEAPVVVNRSAEWKPMELPTERLDLALSPILEELPDLHDAPQLPSDRLPLYPL